MVVMMKCVCVFFLGSALCVCVCVVRLCCVFVGLSISR